MSILLGQPLIHPKLILGYHVIPDLWLLQGGTVGGGGTLNWFNREFGHYEQWVGEDENKSAFEIMSHEAAGVKPGCDGLIFLPYMAGERSPIWDNNARGVFFGLSFSKTRAHLIRAMMEGVGFSLQHNLKTALEVNATVEELISVGGSSNSEVWTQLKADITGKPIQVPFSDQATTLGAALLAAMGIGVYSSFEEAVQRTVRIRRTYQPNPENYEQYQRCFQIYLELYPKLKENFDQLATLN
jgi:xylulokinase